MRQLHGPVGKTPQRVRAPAAELDKMGYVNQHGLSRKVHPLSLSPCDPR